MTLSWHVFHIIYHGNVGYPYLTQLKNKHELQVFTEFNKSFSAFIVCHENSFPLVKLMEQVRLCSHSCKPHILSDMSFKGRILSEKENKPLVEQTARQSN